MISRRALVASLRRAQHERAQLIETIAREKAAIQDEVRRLREQFAADIARLRSELRSAQQEAHRLQMLDYAASCERDLGAPLQ
jgi:hypothetical protein